jgi:hypothetical protein
MSAMEERLVCPIFPFMSINRWHGIKQYKLDGNVIIAPINTLETVLSLPNPLTSISTHMVFVKRRYRYKSAHMQGFVRVHNIRAALLKLIKSSPLYGDLEVFVSEDKMSALEEDLFRLDELFQELDDLIEDDDGEEEDDISDDEDRQVYKESFVFKFETFCPIRADRVIATPKEGRRPLPIWDVPYAEEIAFPSLFGGQPRRVEDIESTHRMSYKDICIMELRNKNRRFAQHIENIFFKLYFSEVKALNSIVSIRGRMSELKNISPSELRNRKQVEKLFSESRLCNEFKNIRGTPHFWEDTKHDLYAFLRQNRYSPTFFISLSMADSR